MYYVSIFLRFKVESVVQTLHTRQFIDLNLEDSTKVQEK
jgi:hypothetical protein